MRRLSSFTGSIPFVFLLFFHTARELEKQRMLSSKERAHHPAVLHAKASSRAVSAFMQPLAAHHPAILHAKASGLHTERQMQVHSREHVLASAFRECVCFGGHFHCFSTGFGLKTHCDRRLDPWFAMSFRLRATSMSRLWILRRFCSSLRTSGNLSRSRRSMSSRATG